MAELDDCKLVGGYCMLDKNQVLKINQNITILNTTSTLGSNTKPFPLHYSFKCDSIASFPPPVSMAFHCISFR